MKNIETCTDTLQNFKTKWCSWLSSSARATVTKRHRLGPETTEVCLTALQAESPRGRPTGLVPGGSSLSHAGCSCGSLSGVSSDDTHPAGPGPHPHTSFIPNHFLIPKRATLGIRTSTYKWELGWGVGRAQFSPQQWQAPLLPANAYLCWWHSGGSRGKNAVSSVVDRCVWGSAETVTNIIQVILDTHEMRHKYNVFETMSFLKPPLEEEASPAGFWSRWRWPWARLGRRGAQVLLFPKPCFGLKSKNLLLTISSSNFTFFLFSESTRFLDVYLFLFDDFLLVTKTKRNKKVKCCCF